jgi:hypothetical protein
MQSAVKIERAIAVPKKKRRPLPFSEDANEPAAVVQDEPVDVERDAPDRENVPVERIAPEDKPAAFEE